MSAQPFLFGELWVPVKDGNDTARQIFQRHYSCSPKRDPAAKIFVGPGDKMVLLTVNADALFVWRKFIDDSGQHGVNCAVFRNEGPALSSKLIAAADRLADVRWPGERHYTYVNPRAIDSENPGYCFKMAGWRPCGISSERKYLIMERDPA